MSYVKKYEVGQIKFDLLDGSAIKIAPYVQYTHELPLLSFGDVQHAVHLSLMFNCDRYREEKKNKNPFFIAPGFKLNLQKCLKYDSSGNLVAFQGEDGNNVELRTLGDTATFNDESQRILRRTQRSNSPIPPVIGGNIEYDPGVSYDHTVEYPDFSKEDYDERGRISSTYDKYGNVVLSYTYLTSGQLESVTFRGSKTVTFGYDESDRLDFITYSGKTISFHYNTNDTLYCIQHYNGVTYTFTSSTPEFLSGLEQQTETDSEWPSYDVNFKCEASATENNATVSYSKNLTLVVNESNNYVYKVKVADNIGNDEVNTVTYRFPKTITLEKPPFNYVDVIDNNGVETRMQIFDHKVVCSYEVQDGSPQFKSDTNRFIGDVTLYNSAGSSKNTQSNGVQTMNSGDVVKGVREGDYYIWRRAISTLESGNGYYTISGWINSSDINFSEKKVWVGNTEVTADEYTIYLEPNGGWQYFSITKRFVDGLYMRTGALGVENFSDVRVTFCGINVENEGSAPYMGATECVLIHESGLISLSDANFYYTFGDNHIEIQGDENTPKQIEFADIMKYKLCKKRNGVSNEVYCNNCKDIITGATDLKVLHNGNYISISNFDLGIKEYSNNKISLTRINVDENNPNSDIVKITKKVSEETPMTSTVFNHYLDVTESTSEGITNYYEYASTNCGLISKQTSAPEEVSKDDTNNPLVIVRQYNYDTDLTTLHSVVDEFGKTTTYTTDDIYGVVTSITLPDETTITDAYDADKSALLSRSFANATNPRSTTFNYAKGALEGLVHGDETNSIGFGFAYTNDKLSSVTKCASTIEEHEYPTNINANSYYPTKDSAFYSQLCTYDKYGRLTKIDGLVENTYDADPYWFYLGSDGIAHTTMNEYNEAEPRELERVTQGVSGKDALLSKMKDSLTSEITEYGYHNKQLTAAITYDTSGSAIRQETFIYDDANRLSNSCFEHNLSANEYVTSDIGYVKVASDPAVDSMVSSYSYKVNGTEKAKTVNTYDDYKRITNKKYIVCNQEFTKDITYCKTRVQTIEDNVGGEVSYTYDRMGRVLEEKEKKEGIDSVLKSYTYDVYGQLVRENNAVLDKTFIYEYDTIGNVTKVKTYAYTTEALGDVVSWKNIGYDITYPDRLTSCGSTSVSYNAIGCPTTYDGYTATWTRGKLSKLTKGLKLSGVHNYYYDYDALGRRTSRSYTYSLPTLDTSAVVAGMLTGYSQAFKYDQSGKLVYESKLCQYYGEMGSNDSIVYLYDENSIIGMVYTIDGAASTYYFHRNLLGDVIGIYDVLGNKVAGYAYDAWGNCTVTLNTNGIATRNPIRYRGYYYDEDTKLYYLNSRYYCPEWRRFISPDDTAYLDPESVNGLNLYAYCGNDPVNYVDPTGHFGIFATILISTLVGAAIGGGVNLGKQLINNGWDFREVDWGSVANSAIVGGALGFSLAMGVGYLGPVIAGTATAGGLTAGGAFAISTAVSFGAGALGYASEEWINGRTPSFGKAMMHGGFVALEGMVNFGVGGIIGSLGNVGTKGKFLISNEWWGKFIFGSEFTQPFKIGIDLIRKNI